MNNMPAIADRSPNPNLGLDNKKDSDPCSMTGVGVIATLRRFVAGAGFEPATSEFQIVSWMVTLAEGILPLLRTKSSAHARIQRKQSGQCKHSLTVSPSNWRLAS